MTLLQQKSTLELIRFNKRFNRDFPPLQIMAFALYCGSGNLGSLYHESTAVYRVVECQEQALSCIQKH